MQLAHIGWILWINRACAFMKKLVDPSKFEATLPTLPSIWPIYLFKVSLLIKFLAPPSPVLTRALLPTPPIARKYLIHWLLHFSVGWLRLFFLADYSLINQLILLFILSIYIHTSFNQFNPLFYTVTASVVVVLLWYEGRGH